MYNKYLFEDPKQLEFFHKCVEARVIAIGIQVTITTISQYIILLTVLNFLGHTAFPWFTHIVELVMKGT